MASNGLKPCPFCGGEAYIFKCKVYLDDAVRIVCRGCGAATPKEPVNHLMYSGGKEIYMTPDMAVQEITRKWNRRAKANEKG